MDFSGEEEKEGGEEDEEEEVKKESNEDGNVTGGQNGQRSQSSAEPIINPYSYLS